MIYSLTGKILKKTLDTAVISCAGVGDAGQVPLTTAESLPAPGREGTVYTVMNVTENDVSLYGFATEEQRSCFKMLTSVSGVGPKAGVAYTTGSFTRPVGLILLAMFVAYIVCNVLAMKNTPAPEEEEQAEEGSFAKELGLLAIGAVLIAVGADLLVDNGTLIAQALGVPESVIALTFVALGTSLPELVTAITSLAKGHGALSLGNVIGANVFNLVLVSGVSVTLAPFSIPQNSTIAGMNASLVMDIPVMFAVMLLLTLPALIKGKLSRPQGIALLCIYAAFCAVQFSI